MESVTIRSLQHFLYCPHRWGLMEIDRAWTENYFVVKANAVHERVHSGESYTARGGKTFTDVEIWNDTFGIVGKLDCVEYRGKKPVIVEYKPSKPKDGVIRHEDAMQLFAQKLCLDQILHTDCGTEIYYSDVKKRFSVNFSDERDSWLNELTELLSEMRRCLQSGIIPPVRKKQKCSGCSMKDLCMPSVLTAKKETPVRSVIEKESEI